MDYHVKSLIVECALGGAALSILAWVAAKVRLGRPWLNCLLAVCLAIASAYIWGDAISNLGFIGGHKMDVAAIVGFGLILIAIGLAIFILLSNEEWIRTNSKLPFGLSIFILVMLRSAIQHGIFRWDAFHGLYILLPYLLVLGTIFSAFVIHRTRTLLIYRGFSGILTSLAIALGYLRPESFSSSYELMWFSCMLISLVGCAAMGAFTSWQESTKCSAPEIPSLIIRPNDANWPRTV